MLSLPAHILKLKKRKAHPEQTEPNYSINIINADSIRIETLKYVIKETERILKSASEGKIHVSPGTTEGNYRYFVRTEGSDKTGTYLHKKDEKRIRSLCQKKYDGDSMLSTYTSLSEGIKCQAEFILE